MAIPVKINALRRCFLITTAFLTAVLPGLLQAQSRVLEEVVVTAQRREQTLQEVPISIQAVSGLELNRQGFRTMEDLGQFSPSVEMNESLHEHSVTIRGQGNDVAAMSVEQSAPIFVDGVHMGRPSMIKGAFMDLERVEVLTGPQPIYFGQNATAGAFSLTTRKPSETWEGDATAEFGNFGRVNFEGGIGGPITNTLGIRAAGQWDHTGGHLTDIFTGNTFPNRTDFGGRLTLVWRPNERIEGSAKLEYMSRNSDGDTNTVCRYETDSPAHDNYSVLLPGEIPEFTDEIVPVPNCLDGFGRVGIQEGTGAFPAPIQGINNDDARSGLLDVRDMARQIMPDGNLQSREPLDAYNLRLGGKYNFANGISAEATIGAVDYHRDTFESSDESPYLMEAAFRTEQFDMYSGELRFTSPSGGRFEWSTGVYYQVEALDMDPVYTLRAEIRQPLRVHHPYQDSEWRSAFASFTFNFLGDKASLDIGGRYTDVHKTGGITAEYATWIFDIDPDPDGNGLVESTEHRPASAGGDRVRNALSGSNEGPGEALINCQTGLDFYGNQPDRDFLGRPVALKQCGPYAGMAGFWTHEFGETDIPDAWDTRSPIALGSLVWGINGGDNGPFQDVYDEDSFDPQITLRYRPNQDHSLYVKYAKAFKGGGFDTSDRGISRGGLLYPVATGDSVSFEADGQKEFSYLAEHAYNYEVGARGTLMGNRLRYGATLFYQKINDLQVETEIADIQQLLTTGQAPTGRYLTNAGAQRNKGLEFDFTWAATDRMTLMMAGVVQDSVMLDYFGGCTESESLDADTGPCISLDEAIEILGLDPGLPATASDPRVTALEGSIDRSGAKAPRAPDWKVIIGADYEMPLFDRYVGRFNTKAAISDGYTEDTLGFTEVVKWPTHADWNMMVGLGNVENSWDINLFARNILQARKEYFPEFEAQSEQVGIQTDDMPQSAWFSYGIQFNYRFR